MNTKNDQKNIYRNNNNEEDIYYSNQPMPVKNMILGIGITNETKDNILEYIIKIITHSSKNCFIVTPNPEIIVAAHKNKKLAAALNEAEIALCDGVGVYLGAKVLGASLRERFTGVDLVEKICEKVNDQPITVGFLGAGPRVAENAAECLKAKYPNLIIVFVGQEWHENKIDILFVAFGFPKQELWMKEHLNKIPVRIMIGVGGSFDYISGKVPRAPRFLRRIGLEWLYRLIRQPWRWKRQLALGSFIWLIMREKWARIY